MEIGDTLASPAGSSALTSPAGSKVTSPVKSGYKSGGSTNVTT